MHFTNISLIPGQILFTEHHLHWFLVYPCWDPVGGYIYFSHRWDLRCTSSLFCWQDILIFYSPKSGNKKNVFCSYRKAWFFIKILKNQEITRFSEKLQDINILNVIEEMNRSQSVRIKNVWVYTKRLGRSCLTTSRLSRIFMIFHDFQ